MKELYRDRRGLAFEDARLMLPARQEFWPQLPERSNKDPGGLQSLFHMEFDRDGCWLCGTKKGKMDLHHLAAGSRGKAQERELFVLLCAAKCHPNVNDSVLGKLVFAKFLHDPEWLDYEWLTIRMGRLLELEPFERPNP